MNFSSSDSILKEPKFRLKEGLDRHLRRIVAHRFRVVPDLITNFHTHLHAPVLGCGECIGLHIMIADQVRGDYVADPSLHFKWQTSSDQRLRQPVRNSFHQELGRENIEGYA